MKRYLFAVRYTHRDESWVEESVCVRADDEAAARTDVDAATERYARTVGATKTITLKLTTEDV